MKTQLKREEVVKVELLARLKLTDAELDSVTTQLGRILDYVEILDEVDTEDVEPMAHTVEMANVFRDDEVRDSLDRDDALANAPKSDGKSFLVPQILSNS